MSTQASQTDFIDFCQKHTPPTQKPANWPSHIHMAIIQTCLWYAKNQYGTFKIKELAEIDRTITQWGSLLVSRLQKTKELLNKPHSKALAQFEAPLSEITQIAQHIEKTFINSRFTLLKTLKRSDTQTLNDACSNIAKYCKLKKTSLTSDALSLIEDQLQSCFPDQHAVNINQTLKKQLNKEKIALFDASQLTFEDL